jgi:hypothetical protein
VHQDQNPYGLDGESRGARSARWYRRWWALGALAVVIVVTAIATVVTTTLSRDRSPQVTVEGTMTIYDGNEFPAEGGKCSGGSGERADLGAGSQLTVHGPDGQVIGVSTLQPGQLDKRGGCVLPFSAVQVPEVDFYQVRSQSTCAAG